MCTNLHQSYTLHNKRNKGRNLECLQQLNVVEEQTKAKLHDQVLQSRLQYIQYSNDFASSWEACLWSMKPFFKVTQAIKVYRSIAHLNYMGLDQNTITWKT